MPSDTAGGEVPLDSVEGPLPGVRRELSSSREEQCPRISPPNLVLSDGAARQLANATKTMAQMSTISPRWLVRFMGWVPVEAGICYTIGAQLAQPPFNATRNRRDCGRGSDRFWAEVGPLTQVAADIPYAVRRLARLGFGWPGETVFTWGSAYGDRLSLVT